MLSSPINIVAYTLKLHSVLGYINPATRPNIRSSNMLYYSWRIVQSYSLYSAFLVRITYECLKTSTSGASNFSLLNPHKTIILTKQIEKF